jgi:hypothetical protein
LITNLVEDGRLRSTIAYPEGTAETMDFELYTPEALVQRAGCVGFTVLEQCCWWDEARQPDAAVRRYQSVFERS